MIRKFITGAYVVEGRYCYGKQEGKFRHINSDGSYELYEVHKNKRINKTVVFDADGTERRSIAH